MSTLCIAVRGRSIIDLIDPETLKTDIYGETLEEVQQTPGRESAEIMTVEEFCHEKGALQNRPITWTETTEGHYYEMLGCLPPAAYGNGAFLVGEPYDHHALTGEPRYQAFRHSGGGYEVSDRPMTVAEFREVT